MVGGTWRQRITASLFNGSERSVSEIYGTVLIISLTFIVAILIVGTGSYIMAELGDDAEDSLGQDAMVVMDDRLNQLSGSPSDASMEFMLQGDVDAQPDEGTFNIFVEPTMDEPFIAADDDDGGWDNSTLGTIVQEHDDGKLVAHQGGGLWEAQNGQVNVLSQPNMRYEGTRVDFGFMNLSSVSSIHAEQEITMSRDSVASEERAGDFIALAAPYWTLGSLEDPVGTAPVNMTVEIESQFADGWYRFGDEIMDQRPDVVEMRDSETVIFEFHNVGPQDDGPFTSPDDFPYEIFYGGPADEAIFNDLIEPMGPDTFGVMQDQQEYSIAVWGGDEYDDWFVPHNPETHRNNEWLNRTMDIHGIPGTPHISGEDLGINEVDPQGVQGGGEQNEYTYEVDDDVQVCLYEYPTPDDEYPDGDYEFGDGMDDRWEFIYTYCPQFADGVDTTPPFFNITVDSVSPSDKNVNVTADEELEVDLTVENQGDLNDTQYVFLADEIQEGTTIFDHTEVTLDPGEENTSITLTWQPRGQDTEIEEIFASSLTHAVSIESLNIYGDEDEPNFDLDLVQAPDDTPLDEEVEFTVEVNNTGDGVDDQNIVMEDSNGSVLDIEQTGLIAPDDDPQAIDFTWTPTHEYLEEEELTVRSEQDDVTHLLNITAPTQDEGFFNVSIVETNAGITEGELLTVNTTIENTGAEQSEQLVALRNHRDNVVDTVSVDLAPGSTTTETLHWETAIGHGDDDPHEITVESRDDQSAEDVRVWDRDEDPAEFEIVAIGSNSPIDESDIAEVWVEVNNTGDVEDTQTISLQRNDSYVEATDVTVGPDDEPEPVSLEWVTEVGDTGTYEMTVATEDDEASTLFAVDELEPDESNFLVNVTADDSVIYAGETMELEVTATNTGDEASTQPIVLWDIHGDIVAYEDVSLGVGETEELTFEWETQTGDAGDGVMTATSIDDEDTQQATVHGSDEVAEGNFEVEIDQHVSLVTESEPLEVGATVTNTGDATESQDIILEDFDGTAVNGTENLALAPSESESITLTWNTIVGDNGTGEVAIRTQDDAATAEATVQQKEGERDPISLHFALDETGSMAANYTHTNYASGDYPCQYYNPQPHDSDDCLTGGWYYTNGGTEVFDGETWLINGEFYIEGEVIPGHQSEDVWFRRFMIGQDPHELRVDATRSFIDALDEDDQLGAYAWNTSITPHMDLTTNHDALRNSITADPLDGTNMRLAIETGVHGGPGVTGLADAEHTPVLVLLTDGIHNVGDHPLESGIVEEAAEEGITIHTVGLGPLVSDEELTEIAEETGGIYVPVDEPEELEEEFEQIVDEVTEPEVPEFEIVDIDAPDQVEQGDRAELEVELSNVGEAAGDRLVTLEHAGHVVEFEAVDIDVGETATVTLDWSSGGVGIGTETLQIGTFDDDDTVSIDVVERYESNFEPTIHDTNSPVNEEETLEVNVSVTNNDGLAPGSESDTQNIVLSTPDGHPVDETTMTLASGHTGTAELTWETDVSDSGVDDIQVVTEDATATETVEILPRDAVDSTFMVDMVEPDPVFEGEMMSVEAVLTNEGNETDEQFIWLLVEDHPVDLTKVSLGPGESTDMLLNWSTSFGDHGDYELAVESEDDIETAQVEVWDAEDAEQGDFQIETLIAQDPVDAGDELDVDVEILNDGDATDTQLIVLENEDGVMVAHDTVEDLAPGETETLQLTWDTSEADTDQEVTVYTENDESSIDVEIEQPDETDAHFDVTITSDHEDPVEVGDTVTVDATIENDGDDEQTQIITMHTGGSFVASEEITVPGDEDTTVSLDWIPEPEHAGDNIALNVSSWDDYEHAFVDVVEDDPSDFQIDIIDHDLEVNETESVEVEVEVTNDGDEEDTQYVVLRDAADNPVDFYELEELDEGESHTLELSYTVPLGVTGGAPEATVELTVATLDDTESFDITVSPPADSDVGHGDGSEFDGNPIDVEWDQIVVEG